MDDELDELLRAVASAPPVDPASLGSARIRLEGRTLGHFRVEERIGEGGMGVVFRAVDERLARRVALKVLRDASGDLLREARTAAAVNHPNLAAIYEVGEAEGVAFIAMELVEGESLRARMKRGLARDDALTIATQIARGLSRAHREGIVHRDLKPENVLVGEVVKILDFGIAGGRGIAGTPAYMAPEAKEGTVDPRVDVWAFGVILYELLSGRGPERPELSRLARRDRRLIERCLAIEPADRPADGAALERELSALSAPRRSWPLWLVGVVALSVIALWARRHEPPPSTLRRLTANVPENDVAHAALSPDGASLAYIDKGGLAVQRIGDVQIRRIVVAEGRSPELVTWMPDGRALVVSASKSGVSAREAWLVPLEGQARRLAEAAFTGLAVSPDGAQLAYAESDRVGVMPFATGALRPLIDHRAGCNISEVAWSRDGARVAFGSLCFASLADTTIETVPIAGGASVVAVRDPRLYNDYVHAGLAWLPTGEILYALAEWLPAEAGANLWSVTVDRDGKAGTPRKRTQWVGTNAWALSADASGRRVAFLRFETQTDVFVGALKKEPELRLEPPRRLTLSERNERPSGWTRDGREVLFFSDRAGNFDLFRQSIDSPVASPIAPSSAWETMPQLVSDGTLLFFRFGAVSPGQGVRPDLFRVGLGGGEPERVLSANAISHPGSPGRPQPWEMRVRCPLHGDGACVFSEVLDGALVFTRIDPKAGRLAPVLRLPKPTAADFLWEMSPDGATLAIPAENGPVNLWSLANPTAPPRAVDVLEGCDPITASFDAEGKGLFVTVECEADGHFELDYRPLDGAKGSARKLWSASPALVLETVPSPDGKNLAIAVKSYDDDVWMVEGL